MNNEILVRMANDIANFFNAGNDEATAAREVANHLSKLWEPGMRRQIIEYGRSGGEGLSPIARAAVAQLVEPAVRVG
jgi:formate dehydrogenase subunit delta